MGAKVSIEMFVMFPTSELVLLLFLFLVKHFLADWQLQTTWMVHGKRRGGFRFVLPLLIHAFIHGTITTYVLAAYLQFFGRFDDDVPVLVLMLGAIDVGTHFIVDRIKALLERLNTKHKFRLFLTVVDQLCHGAVYLGIIYYVLSLY